MKTATIKAYLNPAAKNVKGLCNVKIRVTFDRQHKYYKTNISCTPEQFNRVMTAKRRTETENTLYRKIAAFEAKAIEAAEKIPVFTYDKFEKIYLSNRQVADNVYLAFDDYIQKLKSENSIGTAIAYDAAKKSLHEFKPKLRFADITKTFLQQYENWMLKNGKSITTVGIYLRTLRTIYNRQNIDRSLYPFGERAGGYTIPTGRNIKKALSLEDVSKIFYYEAKAGTMQERARDYFIFLYLCNGMNVKDFCLLKRKNISGNILTYQRAKTMRSKKDPQMITVSLKPEAKEVIKKWGVLSIDPESYLFPHLQKGMTAERQREVYQQLTKNTNKYMKQIAKELNIKGEVTTYFARHSFATILKRTGASVEMIGELLGHSDTKTTQSYLASFENEAIHKATDVLTQFKKAE